MTADIHRGDGGQYIAKIVERELAAHGINPNFQPTVPVTAVLERLEAMQAQLATFQPMQSQLEAMQTQLATFQSTTQSQLMAQLTALFETKFSSTSPLYLLPPPPPPPKPLTIHEVLVNKGYLFDSEVCKIAGLIADRLYTERHGRQAPLIERTARDGELYTCRAYTEFDRNLLEEAIERTPGKTERTMRSLFQTVGSR